MAFDYGAAVQEVLTKGLDAAKTVALERLRINNPNPNVTGPNGATAEAGQPATQARVASVLGSVPTWAWIASAGALALLVLPRFLRR